MLVRVSGGRVDGRHECAAAIADAEKEEEYCHRHHQCHTTDLRGRTVVSSAGVVESVGGVIGTGLGTGRHERHVPLANGLTD